MARKAPVVYLLHGDDEFAISQFVSELESKLGDPTKAVMDITRLDGHTCDLYELYSVCNALPFLASRRLVEYYNPLERLTSLSTKEDFKKQLELLPDTTALALIEHRILTPDNKRQKGEIHWLEDWAERAGDRVYLRIFRLPKLEIMGRWIQERAEHAGGKFTVQAADLLASLTGGDPRLADQEVHKLLAYVDYQRPIDFTDVERLTPDAGQGDIFALVDSLGYQDGRKALEMLHRLIERRDHALIFGMVVRQFRLLIQAKEILDTGGRKKDVVRKLSVPPFVGDKLISQVHRYTLADLEAVYHRLLDIDEAVKSSRMTVELALDTFVVALTESLAQPQMHH